MFKKRLFLYMAHPAPKDAGNADEACLRRLGTFGRSGKRGHEIKKGHYARFLRFFGASTVSLAS